MTNSEDRISFRRLLAIEEAVSELDYTFLVRVPEVVLLSPDDREYTLDIEIETVRISVGAQSYTIKVRSLGHSQHASPDFSEGRRFNGPAAVIVFPDLCSESNTWYEGIDLCLSLFNDGFDIIWLDIEKLSNDPTEWCRTMSEVLPSILSHFGIAKFCSVGFGHGAALILSQLRLSYGNHLCIHPKLPAASSNLQSRLQAEMIAANFQLWVISDPSSGWLSALAQALRKERILALRASASNRRFDPLIVGLTNTEIISARKIPSDSKARMVYAFSPQFKKSVSQFFAKLTLEFTADDFREKFTILIYTGSFVNI